MSSRPLLEAAPVAEDASADLRVLRQKVAQLETEIASLRQGVIDAAIAATEETVKGLLNRMFAPLHNATAMLAGAKEVASATASASNSVWAERIAKAGGAQGKVLQILLDGGGEMSYSQIRAVSGMGGNTSTYLSRLVARNWIRIVAKGVYALK